MLFTVFYLFAAEQADEKVRKVRATLTVDHLRVSWNKPSTPYLSFFTTLMRPKFTRYPPRMVRIQRPSESSYKEPVIAWLYYDGSFSTISGHTNVILDVPGGGFVAMDPRTHDDKLLAWSGKTGLPILSIDYRKAPEYPYPYALNECYDVYHTLIATRGRCIGLSGDTRPRIILTGDSAGGNLATGVVLMVLQSAGTDARKWPGHEALPTPEGLILVYPGLDMNIGNWMTDEQMSLIQDRRVRSTNRNILRRKSEDYYKLTPATPHHSDDEDKFFSPHNTSPRPSGSNIPRVGSATLNGSNSVSSSNERPSPEMAHISASPDVARNTASVASSKPRLLKTRLAMSSMISYFNDRILTPEMMRAMIILYVGPHNRPDFSTDFLLSPLLAPEALLANFPKTYFLTGERDPLVDDTVIFAGRLRQAKYNAFVQRKELGIIGSKDVFDERDHVEVALIPGISHGFLQFASIFPEGWKHIFRCARWMEDIFAASEQGKSGDAERRKRERHHRRMATESSGDDDKPLEMSGIRSPGGGLREIGKAVNGVRRGTRGRGSARKGEEVRRRQRSMVSLASEEDLLGRRMKGLAGGLMGLTADGEATP